MGSGSKKKKGTSPDPGRSMPRITRTPQGGQDAPEQDSGRAFEAMLLAMEERLGAKMEKAASAAQEAVKIAKATSDNLEQLEKRVERLSLIHI